MNPASNLILIGPMGAGKTSIGRRLAERFGLHFVDVDQMIVEQTGSSISEIFAHSGAASFRNYERQTLEQVLRGDGLLISTGGGAVLDAHNRRLLSKRGFVVYLAVGVEAQLKRLAQDRSRPLLQASDREQLLTQMAAERTPLYHEIADLTLNTDSFSPAEAAVQLALQLATDWQISSISV
jgi:shikimate kinase